MGGTESLPVLGFIPALMLAGKAAQSVTEIVAEPCELSAILPKSLSPPRTLIVLPPLPSMALATVLLATLLSTLESTLT